MHSMDTAFQHHLVQLNDAILRNGHQQVKLIGSSRERTIEMAKQAALMMANKKRSQDGQGDGEQKEEAAPPPVKKVVRRGLVKKQPPPATATTTSDTQASLVAADHWSMLPKSALKNVHYRAIKEDFGLQLSIMSRKAATAADDEDSANKVNGSTAYRLAMDACPPPMRCWEELQVALANADGVVDHTTRDTCGCCHFPSAFIQHAVHAMGHVFPSPVQMLGVPVALSGADILATSETGSGKTLSYLLPMLARILCTKTPFTKDNADSGPNGLVLVPTKELATQVTSIANDFMEALDKDPATPSAVKATLNTHVKHRALAVTSDKSHDAQYQELAKGVHLVVGTPGRLKDLLDKHYIAFLNTTVVAIDEADTMIDEALSDDLCAVLGGVHYAKAALAAQLKERKDVAAAAALVPVQTLLYTATLLPQLETIAKQYLRSSYYRLNVPARFLTITQALVGVAAPTKESNTPYDAAVVGVNDAKLATLLDMLLPSSQQQSESSGSGTTTTFADRGKLLGAPTLTHDVASKTLKTTGYNQVIIFVNQKDSCDELQEELQIRAERLNAPKFLSAIAIHGNLKPSEQKVRMEQFRAGEHRILITTDFLARGLDVSGVSLVVNYDLPAVSTFGGKSSPSVKELTQRAVEKYKHRIGRTGRAGRDGVAVSFAVLSGEIVERARKLGGGSSSNQKNGADDDTTNDDFTELQRMRKEAINGNDEEGDDDGGGDDNQGSDADSLFGDDEDNVGSNNKRNRDGTNKGGKNPQQMKQLDAVFSDGALLPSLVEMLRECGTGRGGQNIKPNHAHGRVRVPEEVLFAARTLQTGSSGATSKRGGAEREGGSGAGGPLLF